MKIRENVFLAGAGVLSLRLTSAWDCNVFVLDGGDEAALIDAGGGLEPERIVAEIARDGIDINKVTSVLLTHAHGDHAAGSSYWREQYGMKVYCAEEARPWVEEADEAKFSLDAARRAGIYPADYVFPSCPIEAGLVEGDTITVGDIELQVFETPGHARGHLSYWWPDERLLFSGDVVFPGGRISPQVTWDFSITELRDSIARVHDLQAQTLCAGHCGPLLYDAAQDIAIAHNLLQGMQFPKFLN